MKWAIGCDEAAYHLKEVIKQHLEAKGVEVVDYGTKDQHETVLYPNIALEVSLAVKTQKVSRGILICGTGIGMAMSANKVAGIRAAVCHDAYSTMRSRMSNDAQIMCLGARVIGVEAAKVMVDIWFDSEFQGKTSIPKVEAMTAIEKRYGFDHQHHAHHRCGCHKDDA